MKWKDLEISKKATPTYELTITKDGLIEDITGWTIFFTAKKYMKDLDANAKIAKVITSHYSALSGITRITLTTTDTDLDVGNYYYSIDWKDDETPANKGILYKGRITIEEPVLQTKT